MKRFVYMISIGIGLLFAMLKVDAQYQVINNEATKLLNKPLDEKEAIFWYLGNDGFAIKTKNHLLIIDPYNVGMEHAGIVSSDASLSNGVIYPPEIRDFVTTVFISNTRTYSTGIWLWKQFVYNVNYIFGWDPVIGIPFHDYIYMKPREEKMIGDIKVTTIQATEDGVGFLFEVDGLVIFHGGDHGIYTPEMRERFTPEIDFLADKIKQCDLAFIDFQINAGERRPSITNGIWYMNEKLSPKVIVPMGAMNTNRNFGAPREAVPVTYEYLIKDLINEAPTEDIKSKIVKTEKIGKVFIYSNGKII